MYVEISTMLFLEFESAINDTRFEVQQALQHVGKCTKLGLLFVGASIASLKCNSIIDGRCPALTPQQEKYNGCNEHQSSNRNADTDTNFGSSRKSRCGYSREDISDCCNRERRSHVLGSLIWVGESPAPVPALDVAEGEGDPVGTGAFWITKL